MSDLATYGGIVPAKSLAELIQEIGCSKPLAAHALFNGFLSGLESHLTTLQLAQQQLQAEAKKAGFSERECDAVVAVTADILSRIRAQRASLSLAPSSATQH